MRKKIYSLISESEKEVVIVIKVEKENAKRAIVYLPEKINIANSPELKDKLQSL